MGRPPRIHFPGAVFHAMSRGNGGQPIFLQDGDWRFFLRLLAEVKEQTPFLLYAYCLMTNHFHLLVQVGQIPLDMIMQRLLTRYSHYFNWRRQRTGHVFQARFKPILCSGDAYLMELMRYIHLNPVRAHLVENPADWPWSGHRELLGTASTQLIDQEFPLSLFGRDPRESYRRFVDDGRHLGRDERFYRSALPPILKADSPAPALCEEPRFEACPATLHELAVVVAQDTGISIEGMKASGRTPAVIAARRSLACKAISNGFRLSEIAVFLGRDVSAISRLAGERKRN